MGALLRCLLCVGTVYVNARGRMTMPRVAILLMCAGFAMVTPIQAQVAQDRDPAVGGSPDIPLTPARSNAALQYHSSWMMLDSLLGYDQLTADEIAAIERGELPDSYLVVLAGEEEKISALIDATRLKLCDFGLPYEKGVEALIPQLGEIRQSAKLLIADARRLEETDMDAAVERLAAVIRMGEHASQTKTVIGSLVGVAIADMSREQSKRLLDEGKLSADQAGVLDRSLNRVLTDDPFHSLLAIKTEATIMPVWIKYNYIGKDAGKELSKLFSLVDGAAQGEDKEVRSIMQMNGEQIAKLADQMTTGYVDTVEAWQAEDSIHEMSEVEHGIVSGDYGMVGKLLLPAISNFRSRLIDAEQNFIEFRRELREVTKG
jgi:hypothetical protein